MKALCIIFLLFSLSLFASKDDPPAQAPLDKETENAAVPPLCNMPTSASMNAPEPTEPSNCYICCTSFGDCCFDAWCGPQFLGGYRCCRNSEDYTKKHGIVYACIVGTSQCILCPLRSLYCCCFIDKEEGVLPPCCP